MTPGWLQIGGCGGWCRAVRAAAAALLIRPRARALPAGGLTGSGSQVSCYRPVKQFVRHQSLARWGKDLLIARSSDNVKPFGSGRENTIVHGQE
jgi:hypothetical protein